MSDFIELYDWACWKFGPFEYRLCGYNDRDGVVKCIITEPILGVNVEDQFVETTNHLKFKLCDPIQKSNMIDMAYILDRWMNVNVKGRPGEATNMVLEALGRITSDGQKVERKEDEPLQAAPSKTKKDKSSTRGRKRSKKEE